MNLLDLDFNILYEVQNFSYNIVLGCQQKIGKPEIRSNITKFTIQIQYQGEGSALKAEIKPNSELTIVISTKLENDKIPDWWISHIRNGEKSTMRVKGYLVFDLKIMELSFQVQ